MRYRSTYLIMTVIFLFSAGAMAQEGVRDAIATAKQAVLAQLHDPGSAVFRGVKVSVKQDVCGQVDSRNVEGGRTGYARFIFDHRTRKTTLSLHDPNFRQFFVMVENEYTNGNAVVITDDACSFVRSWTSMCPADMARGDVHAKALCALYFGGAKGRARLKKIVGAQ